MKYLFALYLFIALQEVPYKPNNEFEIKLKYEFRQRPSPANGSTVAFDVSSNSQHRDAGALLPFLTLNVNVISAASATKVKFTHNKNQQPTTKKVKDGASFPMEIGFTDDVKDRITPHEYFLTFIGEDKKEISRIALFIDEDGTFLVNGEKRGRF
jgi:hypothetical protein